MFKDIKLVRVEDDSFKKIRNKSVSLQPKSMINEFGDDHLAAKN